MSRFRSRIQRSDLLACLFAAGGALALLLLLQQPAVAAGAQEVSGAQVYADRCASCHQTFGQGVPGTFPPLAANPSAIVADYVADVVTNGRTGSLQVDGVVYDAVMPATQGLSDAELAAVVDYVVEIAGRTNDPAPAPTAVAASEPPDAGAGRSLFTGSTRFANGGGACASCHSAGDVGNLGGSTLGPDLTTTHNTFGDVGLDSWLSNPPSQTMMPIFEARALTPTERGHLVAFLADAPNQSRGGGPDRLVLAGLGGAAVLLLGMAVAWRGMRQTYLSRLRSQL